MFRVFFAVVNFRVNVQDIHFLVLYSALPCSPKSDTCKTCDAFNVSVNAGEDPEKKQALTAEWELHKCKAERAYHQLQEDTASCKASCDVDMITFDLEQTLPTPSLTTNVVFYKTQLWTYNLGIHSCKDGRATMHMWDESTASRGSEEVGSCLMKYLRESPFGGKHLVCYSDSCGGQNRNVFILCLWLHVVSSPDFSYEIIDHKVMVSGHSYLPNDRDFGVVEIAKRCCQQIYVPKDWFDLVARARRSNPFMVREMQLKDFVNIKNLKSFIVNRKVNTSGEKVEWLNIHCFRVEKSEELTFKYRYTLNDMEPWKTVDLNPKRRGRPSNIGNAKLVPLRSTKRSAKLDDLLSLLSYVPPVHHDFYRSLKGTTLPSIEEEESSGEEQ